jgi:(E)-4-hydroxy-3-methylbut-2-enyl-diphosphate synthase
VISLKAFDVQMNIEAYRKMAELVPYPLHLGVTEAGLPWEGTIRSSVGIGTLLAEGIGDTFRVSLTGDPVEEVNVGLEILSTLNMRKRPYTMVSCPTCGRCEIDLSGIASEVRKRLSENPPTRPLKIAVIGCVVNGPGEAEMADVGIAGGRGVGLLFSRGKQMRRVPEDRLVDELMKEVREIEHNSES